MRIRSHMIGAIAVTLLTVGCGGTGGTTSSQTVAPGSGGTASVERIHSRYLISEFEQSNDAATRRFGGEFVIFESFVDRHGTDDRGAYIRVKSEPFATRFIYCYYGPSEEAALSGLQSGSVAFLKGRVGAFEEVSLSVSECSLAEATLQGGGTKGGN